MHEPYEDQSLAFHIFFNSKDLIEIDAPVIIKYNDIGYYNEFNDTAKICTKFKSKGLKLKNESTTRVWKVYSKDHAFFHKYFDKIIRERVCISHNGIHNYYGADEASLSFNNKDCIYLFEEELNGVYVLDKLEKDRGKCMLEQCNLAKMTMISKIMVPASIDPSPNQSAFGSPQVLATGFGDPQSLLGLGLFGSSKK